jgi:hypothetical protein
VRPDDAADGTQVPEEFDERVAADGDIAGGPGGDDDPELGDRSILEDDDIHGRAGPVGYGRPNSTASGKPLRGVVV